MKKSTKILLCLCVVFIALGTLLILGGIIAGVDPIRAFNEGIMDFTLIESRTSEFSPDGHYTIPANDVSELHIDWNNGKITIEPYDGTDIILEESGCAAFNEHNSLTYSLGKDTLKISSFPMITGLSFAGYQHSSDNSCSDKELHIFVPHTIKWNVIDVAASDTAIFLHDTDFEKLAVDVVDGDLTLTQTNLDSLSFNSICGSLTVNDSKITKIDADSVTGNLTGAFTLCPQTINFSTLSGDTKLYLPADSQFIVHMDTLSGELKSDFSGTYHAKEYTVGNGSAQFSLDTTDGSIQILKVEASR